jgi:hypothetical protein
MSLAAALLLAGLAAVFWPQSAGVTRANIGRIHRGMSRAEVFAVLGLPGDYRGTPGMDSVPVVKVQENYPPPADRMDGEFLVWLGDEGHVCVWLGPEGVIGHGFVFFDKPDFAAWEYLLWRTKRLWRRWSA